MSATEENEKNQLFFHLDIGFCVSQIVVKSTSMIWNNCYVGVIANSMDVREMIYLRQEGLVLISLFLHN